MEKFEFKSQICTSAFQSERLLALGLKKETSDCVLPKKDNLPPLVMPYDKASIYTTIEIIPAWSLGRLLKLMPPSITGFYPFSLIYDIKNNTIGYMCANGVSMQSFKGINIFDNIIFAIKWLIKEGYFNKEYLI